MTNKISFFPHFQEALKAGGRAVAVIAFGSALSIGGPLAALRRVDLMTGHYRMPPQQRDLLHEEMARIDGAIRRDFFANAVPFGVLIHDTAERYDVDPALVAAVVETESDFQRTARSPVGARGLMQIMPETGRWLGAGNLYDAEVNVDAGVRYLKYLQGRYDGNLKKTLAAYNAGEANVARYGGIPPFAETRTYVKRVLHRYETRRRQIEEIGGRQWAPPADSALALR